MGRFKQKLFGSNFNSSLVLKTFLSKLLFVAFFCSQTAWREDSCVEPIVLLMKVPVQKPAYIRGQTCHKAQTLFTKVVLTGMLCELVYGSRSFLGLLACSIVVK